MSYGKRIIAVSAFWIAFLVLMAYLASVTL